MQDQTQKLHLPWSRLPLALVIVVSILLIAGPLLATPVTAQGGTVVRFDPASPTIGIGESVVVNLRIDNVANLAGAEAHITYNAAVIDVTKIESGGFPAPDFVAQSSFGNGKIDYAIAQMPQQHSPANGSGVFLKITVVGKAAGTSPLTFTSVVLADASANSIPATRQNGSVTVGQGGGPTATATKTTAAPPVLTWTPTSTTVAGPTNTPTSTTVSGSGATLRVNPRLGNLVVTLENASNLWALDLKLTFDQSLAQCTGSTPGQIPKPDIVARNSCTANALQYIVTQKLGTAPANGSGDVVQFTLACRQGGRMALHFESVKLTDNNGMSLPVTAVDGQYDCGPTPTFTPTPTVPVGTNPAILKVDPNAGAMYVGSQGVLKIAVENARNLWAIDATLNYDSSIVKCLNAVTGQAPKPEIIAKILCSGNAFSYIVSQKSPTDPYNGNGPVAQLTFLCLKPGKTNLTFTNVKLTDRDGRTLPVQTVNGTLTCVGSTITRLRIDPAASSANVNESRGVNVKVEGANNLTSLTMQVMFDPSIVQCVGSVPGNAPRPDQVMNQCATNALAYTARSNMPFNGNGTAVQLTLKCIKPGTTPLTLTNVVLTDGGNQQATLVNGTFTCYQPCPNCGGIIGYHTVRGCETLYCIARAYGISPWAIASVNHIRPPYWVYVGQRLAIPNVPWTNPTYGPVCHRQFNPGSPPPPPPPTPPPPSGCRFTYRVMYGDTVSAIAWRFRTTVSAIVVANHLPSANYIWAGQRLCIP